MLSLLYPIASLLGIEAGELVERAKKNGLLWAAIALFAAIALVFALIAAHTALTLWAGPVYAPLIIAGASVLLATGLYVTSRVVAAAAHRREVQRRRSAETTALATTAAISALPILMRSPLMKRIGLPLGGALAALFLLSRSGGKSDEEDAES
jgi:uncharacterized integral membrane protein